MITSNNVAILKNFPLVEELNNDFKKPVYLENDARVATLAEAIKGAGKDKKVVCYVTISTGLGGGVVIDKKIYHGSNDLGAYFSRMILDGKNTSNSLISGTALINQAREKISTNISNSAEVFELEKSGNVFAKEIIENFKRNLTVLLLNISSTINPEIIVLGGGVLKSKDRFLDEVIDNFKEKAHILAQDTIIDTAYFDEPGIVGAMLLAKRHFE
jgi:glucokinase